MKSPIILRVFKGNQLKEVKQFDLEQVVIGHQADVQLDLDDPEISPIHCMIEFRPEGYFICDLGSEYGTLKNGQRILDEPLQSNDEIQLGQYRILFFSGVPKTKTVPVVPIPTIPLQKPEPVSAGLETVQSRPKIRENKNTQTNSKSSKKTFAPGAQIPELQTFLKPHKGGSVEVLVCWGDRIIEAFHYRRKSVVQVNTETENRILLPHGVLPRGFRLLEIGQGVRVNFPQSSQIELVNNQNKWTMPDLLQQGRVQPTSQNSFLQLEQNEVLHIGFKDSQLRLVIRYVPLTPVVPLIPPLMLSSGELMGVLVALAISILVFLAVSTSLPPEIPEEEQLTRIAQIVFDNKPQPVPPIPEQKPPQDEVVKTPPPPPKEEPQKVEALDKNQQQVKKGQGEVKTAQQNQRAGRASEVAPKPNTQNKPKKFTSVKQGGAVKIADKGGANANSQVKDVSKVGLFSAFGSGGVRKQLDQAYSGAGDILGTAGQATGTAGMGAV
ncbi:MAG: FHA domain-containing protein, partial [Bdellovibrionales bacterium]